MVAWSSSLQPFAALSTAEAELIGYVEGHGYGGGADGGDRSTGGPYDVRSEAGIQICCAQMDPFRTRHL